MYANSRFDPVLVVSVVTNGVFNFCLLDINYCRGVLIAYLLIEFNKELDSGRESKRKGQKRKREEIKKKLIIAITASNIMQIYNL